MCVDFAAIPLLASSVRLQKFRQAPKRLIWVKKSILKSIEPSLRLIFGELDAELDCEDAGLRDDAGLPDACSPSRSDKRTIKKYSSCSPINISGDFESKRHSKVRRK